MNMSMHIILRCPFARTSFCENSEVNMNKIGEEPSWEESDVGGAFQVFIALLCIITCALELV